MILSAILSTTLLTGSKKDNDSTSYESEISVESNDVNRLLTLIDEDGRVYVPSYYNAFIGNNLNNINLTDLAKLKELSITVPADYQVGDLMWLNCCVNLERLNIITGSDDVLSDIYVLPNLYELDLSKNFVKGELYNLGETLEKKNCGFMYRSSKLAKLKIANFNIEKGLIETLTNLQDLYLISNFDEVLTNYDIDYSKLTFLNNLIINKPYSVITHMSTDEIMELRNSGVSIFMYGDEGKLVSVSDLLIEANYMIDKMVSEINIKDNMSDMEKVRNILYYVLDKLSYDEDVKRQLDNSQPLVNISSFYQMGYLYGALNRESAICANYASLFATLCDRVNVSGIVSVSYTHAWNVMNIDDCVCYIDPTNLDNYYENDNDKLALNNVLIGDLLNEAINIPEEMNVDNLKVLSIMSNKKIRDILVTSGVYSLDIVLLFAIIYLSMENRKNNVKRLKRNKK